MFVYRVPTKIHLAFTGEVVLCGLFVFFQPEQAKWGLGLQLFSVSMQMCRVHEHEETSRCCKCVCFKI